MNSVSDTNIINNGGVLTKVLNIHGHKIEFYVDDLPTINKEYSQHYGTCDDFLLLLEEYDIYPVDYSEEESEYPYVDTEYDEYPSK